MDDFFLYITVPERKNRKIPEEKLPAVRNHGRLVRMLQRAAPDLFMNRNEIHGNRGIVKGLQLLPVLLRQQGNLTDSP